MARRIFDIWEDRVVLFGKEFVYENGLSRELFKRYNGELPDMMVAYAIAAGILKREEIPAELFEALTGPLEYFDRLKERGELKIPKE